MTSLQDLLGDGLEIIERASLPGEEALLYSKPWLLQLVDGDILQFDTIEEADAEKRQRIETTVKTIAGLG